MRSVGAVRGGGSLQSDDRLGSTFDYRSDVTNDCVHELLWNAPGAADPDRPDPCFAIVRDSDLRRNGVVRAEYLCGP